VCSSDLQLDDSKQRAPSSGAQSDRSAQLDDLEQQAPSSGAQSDCSAAQLDNSKQQAPSSGGAQQSDDLEHSEAQLDDLEQQAPSSGAQLDDTEQQQAPSSGDHLDNKLRNTSRPEVFHTNFSIEEPQPPSLPSKLLQIYYPSRYHRHLSIPKAPCLYSHLSYLSQSIIMKSPHFRMVNGIEGADCRKSIPSSRPKKQPKLNSDEAVPPQYLGRVHRVGSVSIISHWAMDIAEEYGTTVEPEHQALDAMRTHMAGDDITRQWFVYEWYGPDDPIIHYTDENPRPPRQCRWNKVRKVYVASTPVSSASHSDPTRPKRIQIGRIRHLRGTHYQADVLSLVDSMFEFLRAQRCYPQQRNQELCFVFIGPDGFYSDPDFTIDNTQVAPQETRMFRLIQATYNLVCNQICETQKRKTFGRVESSAPTKRQMNYFDFGYAHSNTKPSDCDLGITKPHIRVLHNPPIVADVVSNMGFLVETLRLHSYCRGEMNYWFADPDRNHRFSDRLYDYVMDFFVGDNSTEILSDSDASDFVDYNTSNPDDIKLNGLEAGRSNRTLWSPNQRNMVCGEHEDPCNSMAPDYEGGVWIASIGKDDSIDGCPLTRLATVGYNRVSIDQYIKRYQKLAPLLRHLKATLTSLLSPLDFHWRLHQHATQEYFFSQLRLYKVIPGEDEVMNLPSDRTAQILSLHQPSLLSIVPSLHQINMRLGTGFSASRYDLDLNQFFQPLVSAVERLFCVTEYDGGGSPSIVVCVCFLVGILGEYPLFVCRAAKAVQRHETINRRDNIDHKQTMNHYQDGYVFLYVVKQLVEDALKRDCTDAVRMTHHRLFDNRFGRYDGSIGTVEEYLDHALSLVQALLSLYFNTQEQHFQPTSIQDQGNWSKVTEKLLAITDEYSYVLKRDTLRKGYLEAFGLVSQCLPDIFQQQTLTCNIILRLLSMTGVLPLSFSEFFFIPDRREKTRAKSAIGNKFQKVKHNKEDTAATAIGECVRFSYSIAGNHDAEPLSWALNDLVQVVRVALKQ